MSPKALVMLVAATSLTVAACGGSTSDSSADATAADTTVASAPDTPATTDPPPGTEPATEASTVAPAATEAPTTTLDATVDAFDLTSLPELVGVADAAIGDPTIEPFDVVDQIIGFPLSIGVPDGSSLLRFDATLETIGDDGVTDWLASYDAVGPGGSVDDIDITLDDNGPGSRQLTDFFDPIMIDLGFQRANTTASDPGDPGGPNSVNHEYLADDPALAVNGVPATLDPVFIWSTEDVNGWAFDDSLEQLGGYSIDVAFETAPETTSTPFPLANAVIDAFPLPAGLTLNDVSIRLQQRSADSFSIDDGASFIEISITWIAAPDSFDDVAGFYVDPTTAFTDEAVFLAASRGFSTDGTLARAVPYEYNGTDRRLDVVLLQRYGGLLGIDASVDGIEPVEVRLDLVLNPNDVLLASPTE
jgi:hypothetical protein